MSTPRMIALMETTAKELLDKYLDQEHISVGYHVDVYHKAPAPLGAKLVFRAKVIEVVKNKVKFEVKCLMGDIVIGEGIHERAIVSWNKFAEKSEKVS
ncbi:MAG: thioesterase [Staphylothermus sp.]|nr:thioesterase [Staphylothermus sp.]